MMLNGGGWKGAGDREKRGGKCTGGGRRWAGMQDSQGGGEQKNYAILRNISQARGKNAKRRESEKCHH